MADTLWYRQDVDSLSAEWFFLLSSDARIAWVMLKGYVKCASVSQKAPNKAPALSDVVAGHQWRVPKEAVAEMTQAAIAAKELMIEDGAWVVVNKLIYMSQRTIERLNEPEGSETFGGQTPTNADKRRQTPPSLSRDPNPNPNPNNLLSEDNFLSATPPNHSPAAPPNGEEMQPPRKKRVYCKSAEFLEMLPLEFQTLEFKASLEDWLTYKKEKSQGYVQTGMKAACTTWKRYGPDVVAQQMTRAMANGWMGLNLEKMEPGMSFGLGEHKHDPVVERMLKAMERNEND